MCLFSDTCVLLKINIAQTAKTVRGTTNMTVDQLTLNLIYCVFCDRCSVQYIGESELSLQQHFSEHKGYAMNSHLNKATGEHFNLKGHKVYDMRVIIVVKVFSQNPGVRKERESH